MKDRGYGDFHVYETENRDLILIANIGLFRPPTTGFHENVGRFML